MCHLNFIVVLHCNYHCCMRDLPRWGGVVVDGVRRVSASGARSTSTLVSMSQKWTVTGSAPVKDFPPSLFCSIPGTTFVDTRNLLPIFVQACSAGLCVSGPTAGAGFLKIAGLGGIFTYPIISCHLILVHHLNLVCSDPQFRGEATPPPTHTPLSG